MLDRYFLRHCWMSCSNIQETRFFYCISLELEQFRNVGKIKKR